MQRARLKMSRTRRREDVRQRGVLWTWAVGEETGEKVEPEVGERGSTRVRHLCARASEPRNTVYETSAQAHTWARGVLCESRYTRRGNASRGNTMRQISGGS
eukprot:452595-Rhodomonas_salina.1